VVGVSRSFSRLVVEGVVAGDGAGAVAGEGLVDSGVVVGLVVAVAALAGRIRRGHDYE
jgi:hypothetical protein